MPRPIKCRRVNFEPEVTYFKPAGIPLNVLNEITINIEDIEALRLKDYEGLSEIKAAKKMGISQSTFNRIIKSAHKKIAEAISKGYAIKIEGGNFKVINEK